MVNENFDDTFICCYTMDSQLLINLKLINHFYAHSVFSGLADCDYIEVLIRGLIVRKLESCMGLPEGKIMLTIYLTVLTE